MTIKNASPAAYITNCSIAETHAAVTIPLYNLDDNPGLLLEVRGKVCTYSREVRCVFFCSLIALHPRWSGFPGGMVGR